MGKYLYGFYDGRFTLLNFIITSAKLIRFEFGARHHYGTSVKPDRETSRLT